MPRKIQRKPIRNSPERIDKKVTTDKDINIRDTVTILGGTTGLFVAVLWLAGRSYAAGYFSAMNIPSFQINFSIWEYAEASWQRLIFYFLSKIYTPLVLIATIILVVLLAAVLLQRIIPKLKIVGAVKNMGSQILQLRASIGSILGFSLAACRRKDRKGQIWFKLTRKTLVIEPKEV